MKTAVGLNFWTDIKKKPSSKIVEKELQPSKTSILMCQKKRSCVLIADIKSIWANIFLVYYSLIEEKVAHNNKNFTNFSGKVKLCILSNIIGLHKSNNVPLHSKKYTWKGNQLCVGIACIYKKTSTFIWSCLLQLSRRQLQTFYW